MATIEVINIVLFKIYAIYNK